MKVAFYSCVYGAVLYRDGKLLRCIDDNCEEPYKTIADVLDCSYRRFEFDDVITGWTGNWNSSNWPNAIPLTQEDMENLLTLGEEKRERRETLDELESLKARITELEVKLARNP